MSIPEFSTQAQLKRAYLWARCVPRPSQKRAEPQPAQEIPPAPEGTVSAPTKNGGTDHKVLLDILRRGPVPFSHLGQPRSLFTVSRAQDIVAHRYGFTVAELCSIQRHAKLVLARHIAMYVAKTLSGKSLPEIGRRFCRDHTTVMMGVRRIVRLIEVDEEFASEIAEIMDAVRGDTDSSVDQTNGSGRG